MPVLKSKFIPLHSPTQKVLLGIPSNGGMSLEALFALLPYHFQFHVYSQLCFLLIRPDQHINHTSENSNGSQQADDIQISRKCRTNLVNHQRHRIG